MAENRTSFQFLDRVIRVCCVCAKPFKTTARNAKYCSRCRPKPEEYSRMKQAREMRRKLTP